MENLDNEQDIEENTILWWFQKLPQDIKAKAIKNTINRSKGSLNVQQGSLYDALGAAFIWNESPEGDNYWRKIANGSLPNE